MPYKLCVYDSFRGSNATSEMLIVQLTVLTFYPTLHSLQIKAVERLKSRQPDYITAQRRNCSDGFSAHRQY